MSIDNLEKKLNGELPVTREELLVLVNSWGRLGNFDAKASNNQMLMIDKCDSKECYNLSKLDTSEITDMSSIFRSSNFNSDISNWNTSNVTSMEGMFNNAESFNQSIGSWDVSNVTNMFGMFAYATEFNQPLNNWDTSKVTNMESMFEMSKKFNQNISSWNLDNIINCDNMFDAKAFLDKYNSGKPLSSYTDKIKEWFNLNRERMNEIDIKENHGKEIDDFFNIISNTKKIIF